jgi:hypothetical protein
MAALGRIIGRVWARVRSWPLWIQVIVGLIVVAVVAAPFASKSPKDVTSRNTVTEETARTAEEGKEAVGTQQPKGSPGEARCVPVVKELLRRIESGLTSEGGGRLRDESFAVKSRDFAEVWMVAAEIDAPGLEGIGDIAVWGTNEDPSKKGVTGLIIRANGLAAELSDWGSAAQEGSAADLKATDDGVAQAEACVREALES